MPYLQLPSGAYFKMPEGASPAEAFALAQQKHPNEFLTPGEKENRQGFGAAAGTAFREATASTKSGLGELFNNQTLKDLGKQDKLAAQKDQFIPTTSEDIDEALRQGLIPGAGAAFRKYVSEPVGGIVGRYGAPMAIGAGAAALAPAAGVGVVGAGLIGSAATALADLPAEVADNLTRAEETHAPKDINKALGYGLIQAALTGFGIPGTGLAVKAVNKYLGKEALTLGEQVAKGTITKEQAIAKLHGPVRNTLEGMGVNAVTGTAMMVGTEAARRASADQGVFTPEAFETYKENAIAALELSPIFGALHGLPKRGRETKAIEAGAGKRQAELDKQQREEQDRVAVEQATAAQQAEQQRQQAEFQKQQMDTGNLFGEVPLQEGVKGKKVVEGAVSPLPNVADTRTVAERENAQATEQANTKELFATKFDTEQKVERLEKELIAAAQKGDLDTITKIQPLLKGLRTQVETVSKQLKEISPVENRPDVLMATYRGQLKKKMAELAKYAESNPEKVDKLVPEIKELQAKIDEVSKQGVQLEMFEPAAMAAEKRIDERAAKEQLDERQQDLFAQLKTKDKNEGALDKYQQGLLDLEEAHAAGASDRIINKLIDALRHSALEKEASRTGVVSGEVIENQRQRVERIKRSLEEAKESYNDANSDAERQQHISTIGVLQDRLATAEVEIAKGRPEVAEKEAFTRQEEAKRDALETVRAILSGEYFNSRNVDVASTMKSGLEIKISDSGKEYAKATIDEINAVRKQYKQESLSVDDALKLTTTLQKQFDLLAKDPTILARRTKRLEKAIALTEKAYAEIKDSSKKFDIKRQENFLNRLAKQKEELAEQKIKSDNAVKGFEESLERIKKDYFEGKSRVQRGPFELAQERNPIEILRREERKKKNRRPDLIEGAEREIEAGKKENERLAAEKEKAEIKEPEGVNPDQFNLFGEKELEPIATVRASHENFVKLLNSATVRKIKERLAAEKPVEATTPKKEFESPNAAKVRELEALRLKIENMSSSQRPSRFEPTEKQKQEMSVKALNKMKAVYDRRLFLHDLALNRLKVQEKKLAAEIKGTENTDTLSSKIKQQKDVVEELKAGQENIETLVANARDLFKQRSDLLKYIEGVKKTLEEAQKLPDTDKNKRDRIATFRQQLRNADEGLQKLDGGGPAARAKVLELVDRLHARANKIEFGNLKREETKLKTLEKEYEKAQELSVETKAAEAKLAEERRVEGINQAKVAEQLEKNVGEKRKTEQQTAEVNKTLPSKRQEVIATNVKTPGSDEIVTRKQITEKRVPKTEAEKTAELRETSAEGARQMAEIKKMQDDGLKLKEVKKVESKIKRDLTAKKEQIESDVKKLSVLERTVQDAKSGKAKAEAQQKVNELKKEINSKNLGAVVDVLEKNLKLLKGVGVNVERAMVILGNNPARTERKKPLKTGVSKVEADVAEAIASEKHGYGENNTYYEGPSRNRYRLTASGQNGLPPSKARAFVENLNKKLPKDIKITYVDRFTDLPEKERKGLEFDGLTGENGSGVRGFVNHSGEVYIIGGNHTSMKDLETTYVHELIGHVGVDRILGEKGFEALTKRINDQHGGVLKLADELGIRDLIDGTLADYMLTIKKSSESGAPKSKIDALLKDMEIRAVRELIAHTAEQRVTEGFVQKANRWMKELVGAVRAFLRDNGFAELSTVSTSDIFNIIRQSERSFQRNELGGFRTNDGTVVFRRDPVYSEGFNSSLKDTANTVYQKEKTVLDRLKGNALGMTMAHRFVDRFAGLEYIARNMRDKLEGLQMMYYNRLYDQRNNMMSEIATHGPVGIVKDEKNGTYSYASKKGPSLAKVAEVAGKAKDEIGNGTAALEQFGLYLAVERAASNKGGLEAGLEALNLAGKVTTKMADEVLKFGRGNTHFQEARKMYREYNNGQLDFMVESGRLSKEQAAEMKKGDYVAYYRIDKNDEIWDNERNVKVGDLKTQSYLRELMGGDSAIVNFETGALQNTYMLTDMAMGNIAAKNTAYTLQKLGVATVEKGDGSAAKDVIRFYENGEKMHATINTSDAYKSMETTLEKMRTAGKANTPEYKKLRERAEASRESSSMFGDVPAELIVKGMEGVSMALPEAVSFLRGPADLLRKGVTRNPAYAMRVAFKDSLSGWITSGADNKPILGTLEALSKMAKKEAPEIRKLQEQGIIGGHVFSGTMSDMRTIALQMAEGKSGWEKLWAKADRLAIIADESARLSLYNGFVKKGMSSMEASLATLEAQNFTKHGYSPTVRMLSTMIPFFNSQIQGLNVFARAISGKSLFEDKLGVRETMLKRGATVAGLTLAYTALMQNNEAYKNADEYDKLNYWFVPLPFFKDPIKVPIPFESGVVFKALPEAMYNLAATDAKSKDVLPAVAKLLVSQVPGVSNLFLPQGVKPIVEGLTNTNFYSMSPIESQRQLQELPGYRSNATTTELSKVVGRTLGVSPIQIDHLVNGYTGSVGTAMMSMFNPMLREGSAPDTTSKDLPIVGGFFQPTDAGGLINKAYADMQAIEQTSATYKRLNEQDPDKADAFYRKYVSQIDNATAAGTFKQKMGEYNTEERSIRADKSLSSSEKRKRLDENRQDKIQLAKDFRAISNE